MLSPKEIEKRSFSRAMRGYNTDEVDEYIDFLCQKYELIYSENLELNEKLKAALQSAVSPQEMERIKASETVEKARAQAEMIVSDAEKQADLLYSTAKKKTNEELSRFKLLVSQHATELLRLKQLANTLRQDIIDTYSKGIMQAQSQVPEAPYEKASEYARVLLQTVLSDVKDELTVQENEPRSQISPVQSDEKKQKPVIKKTHNAKFKGRSVKDAIKEINNSFQSEDTEE